MEPYDPMREAHEERTGFGDTIQYPRGNQRVSGSFDFPQDKHNTQDETRHKDAQDFGRVPRKHHTAKIEAQQSQHRHAHDGRSPNPVHLPAFSGTRSWPVGGGVEEHVEDDKRDKAARKVDPEHPAPVQVLREHTSQKRTDPSRDSPD